MGLKAWHPRGSVNAGPDDSFLRVNSEGKRRRPHGPALCGPRCEAWGESPCFSGPQLPYLGNGIFPGCLLPAGR